MPKMKSKMSYDKLRVKLSEQVFEPLAMSLDTRITK